MRPEWHPPPPLSRSFYAEPTLALAPKLLGKVLYRRLPDGAWLAGRIVEVEAYHQEGDAAAHSFRGKTPRNEVMFGEPGRLYVYFIYGMHYCMNVVTESAGIGAAVLIRAIEPIKGRDHMLRLRGFPKRECDLTNGPAKCCQALSIGPDQNGHHLDRADVLLGEGHLRPAETAMRSARIGITKSAHLPWRFFIADHPCVSRGPKRETHEPI